MNPMFDKLSGVVPEMVLLVFACVCLAVGLSRSASVRRLAAPAAGLGLVLAGAIALMGLVKGAGGPLIQWNFAGFVKVAIAGVGLLLLMVAAAVPDTLKMNRDTLAGKTPFDAGNVMRGEFFAFLLLSLTGAMLCAGAGDLVWLFLALELTSLPTYVMVATARDKVVAQESAVKYFFLGAMSAAMFLYGFTLIYGATGQTEFEQIRQAIIDAGGPSPLLLLGVVLSVVGISFKIAAVPMHFYAADVYQGATTPVTAFLAFVPKTAGFVALILVLGLVRDLPQLPPGAGANGIITWGGGLPAPIAALLWVMAVLTMTVGNVLGLLQSSVKRVLAYSSIAHSGYMLVGVIATTAMIGPQNVIGNGVAAVLFYLVAYGLATLGAFAVLGCLQRDGDEADDFDALAGLAIRRPILAAIMLLCVLSLIGLPTMVGFLGKIYLFGSAIKHGYVALVVIALINSAISAVYYLRIASACYFGTPDDRTQAIVSPWRQAGAAIAALSVLIGGFTGGWLVGAANQATTPAVNHMAPQVVESVEQLPAKHPTPPPAPAVNREL